MKKTLILVAVALMAIPAWAAVTVTGTDQGSGVGAITYTFSASPSPKVRAFALNISVDNGAVISAVTVGSSAYTIYPGTIQISGNSVTNPGTPVAVPAQLPGDTLGGIGTSGVTLEMASLYVGEANAPATSGTLVTITVDKSCTVSIASNVSRGGVVMEDLSAITPTYTSFPIVVGPTCSVYSVDITGDQWLGPEDLGEYVFTLSSPYATGQGNYLGPGDPGFNECLDLSQDGWMGPEDLGELMFFLSAPAQAANGNYADCSDPAVQAWYASVHP